MVKKGQNKSKETDKGCQKEVEWSAMKYGQPYSSAIMTFCHFGSHYLLIANPAILSFQAFTMIFSEPDIYFKNDKHEIFMMFEEAMGRTLPTDTSMVCWYLENWLSNYLWLQ